MPTANHTPFRQRREELHLSHEQVASLSGFTVRTVYRLELEGRLPGSAGAEKAYAAALKLSVPELQALAARALMSRKRKAKKAAKRASAAPVPSAGLFLAGVLASSSCPQPKTQVAQDLGQVAQ